MIINIIFIMIFIYIKPFFSCIYIQNINLYSIFYKYLNSVYLCFFVNIYYIYVYAFIHVVTNLLSNDSIDFIYLKKKKTYFLIF